MKSFPNMVDMVRSQPPADPMGLVNPCDLPDYDYGLSISLNQESLDKLDLDNDVTVGDFVEIHAFARVTSISQPPGAEKPDRVSLVLTHMSAEDEDEE